MERKITIKNPTGLHARPAAMLVKKAAEFSCEITLIKGDKKANAKSIMNLLALGLAANDEVTVVTAGEKEAEALQAIGDFLDSLKD